MMREMFLAVVVMLMPGLAAVEAKAQATRERPAESAAGLIPPGDSPFAEGKWQVSIYGGAIKETFRGNETVAFGATSIEYFVVDDWSVMLEPIGYSISDADPDTYGLGLNLGFRWHFATFDRERVALYWEGVMGIVSYADRAPNPEGTHGYFTLWTGPGVKWRITDNLSLIAGGRYFHQSNARRRGKSRNQAMDGFGGYGGLTLHF